ncbi:hypothetical protein BJF89_16750 [Corynebacterium sp. CNJ-954]|uniref:pentapeptide repeat-containing protein n=1 Tax=Corynebacterium sp. CNJ-954 TaxID=1904962 RepID=UPI00095EC56D|nr:pentapeptide repeat-containing protein [Corynebacterium sp. CNJ-954]OLT54424.1 hypothetical protein BJF89_16750 [Corynebacterium sp. CNJ-954]
MNPDKNTFSQQDLRGHSFAGQDLTHADFSESDLRTTPDTSSPTTADNILRTDFTNATLTSSRFVKVRANRALFVDTNLSGADLTRADFTQADFTGADLSDANLTGATIDRTNFALTNRTGTIGLEEV